MTETKQQPKVKCRWTLSRDPDADFWESGCGNAFQFTEGGPVENRMQFCPYCGKPLKEQG